VGKGPLGPPAPNPAGTHAAKKSRPRFQARKRRNYTVGVGRPTLLTDQIREQIERELSEGVPVYVVAQSAGVSKRTLHSWLADGRVIRRPRLRLVDDEVPVREEPDDEFEDVDATFERALVGSVLRASRDDWRAAKWLLERRYPRKWGRR
jgi:transposase